MLHSLPISFAILRAAALLVPRSIRPDWLAEWRGELWQVCQAHGVAWASTQPHGQKEITAFCLGAFQDALTLRLDCARSQIIHRLQPGAPLRSMASLAALLLVSLLLCLGVPAVRNAAWGSAHLPTDELVLVSSEGHFSSEEPTVRFAEYQSWKARGLAPFHGLIFYRPIAAWVRLAGMQPRKLHVGYANDSLMALLSPSLAGTGLPRQSRAQEPLALLSRRIWQRDFHADPHVTGRTFLVGDRLVTVAGIAANDFWPIPGKIDMLLIETDAELAASLSSSSSMGFVLAPAIRPALRTEDIKRPYILLREPSETVARFECLSLAQRREKPRTLFLISLLLACLALPATTPLPMGDYPELPGALPFTVRVRRWIFLASKFALIVPTAFLAPLFVSCSLQTAGTTDAAYLQIAFSFLTMLFAFRWALQDQRKRCPTCLRLLSHPAIVGHASQSFLAWSGTEMLCIKGHGFLYIPQHPTSWFSTQRWLPVDASWTGFFSAAQPVHGRLL